MGNSLCGTGATKSANNPKLPRTGELVAVQVQVDQRRAGAQLRGDSTCAGGVQQLNSVCVDLVLHRPNRIQISRTSELVAAQREAPQVGQLLQLGWDCACTHGTFLN